MTEKEKLYRDFRLATMHETVTQQDLFSAGFEAAKRRILETYFNTPGDHYNKQRTLEPEEIIEIGQNQLDESI